MTMLTFTTDELTAAAPRHLKAESAGLTPDQFRERYCDRTGPIRLAGWSSTGSRNGAFTATVGFNGYERTVVAAGSPVAAMTSALYEAGYPVEILQFHQRRTGAGTATFIRCEFNGRRGWGAALAADGAESSVRAMIAGLNGLGA
ncbi:alpha-isopropylmalate synthase regulatory domain-containing protein [Nocardia donostiensis]|uniref:2-keto-3-deoxygluconate kinase n=1 Tax=Nocardia donostiensis TaxID=1538463 RepID=A0A1W0ASN3_9NOCA|nr:alpha-isopropylmalate synthase regulatory domain-containing protein [Nocardia donostiensis]ONM46892.1 2-keto-3-deoxygluconate kinase [Nocardia donostiensis]OQS13241.1 2-keto-3-deoxygluconate kinase [Nocardia donostiensis]OQS19151.1 2-keto-3-deoxygluconate kinase [Nocardia donostiensis]